MFSGYHSIDKPETTFISFKMPATESELRSLMMDMKKSYFNGQDHILEHKDLYLLLSWMEDVINDSVKLSNYDIKEKKGKHKWK